MLGWGNPPPPPIPQPYGEWNQKRCQIPLLPQSTHHRRHWGSPVGPGRPAGGTGGRGASVWPTSGPRRWASTGWSGAQSPLLPGSQFRGPPAPPPQLRPRVPLPHLQPRGQDALPGPRWQPAPRAGPQQSQTHRGPHGRGVAAGRGRAAHCDQRHGVRRGHWAGSGHGAAHGPTDSPCPAGPGRRDQSHPAWHLLGGGP